MIELTVLIRYTLYELKGRARDRNGLHIGRSLRKGHSVSKLNDTTHLL